MDELLAVDIRTRDDALRWLYGRIDYERVRPGAQSNPFRLERIQYLLTRIGAPQQRIPCVHIAGTKGKGSTAAMLESILRHSGIRTGLFTSPHIHLFEERLRVDGQIPSPGRLTDLVRQLATVLENDVDGPYDRSPTFFEVSTLLAWMLFDQQQVEVAVMETGLGGRLDCTNVCCPLLTIITSIGLDHTQILGDTIELIAAEKAGIIKAGVPVIQGALPPAAAEVVQRHAARVNVPALVCGRDFSVHASASNSEHIQFSLPAPFAVRTPSGQYTELTIPLTGHHQQHNAALAVTAADWLRQHEYPRINEASIRSGLAGTIWPLRFERFPGDPQIILDAAHNPDSAAAVANTLQHSAAVSGRKILIFASSADKDAATMLRLLVPCFAHVIVTRYVSNPRSIPPEQLQALVVAIPGVASESVSVADNPEVALLRARQLAATGDLICVTGSLFLAGEVRTLLSTDASPFPVMP
jgi:dihydrofolate synthase / folylpolyglutamate synthase